MVDEDINWYDVRYPLDDLGFIPPMNWVDYVSQANISAAIGARTNFTFCSDITEDLFDATGDGKSRLAFHMIVSLGSYDSILISKS